MRLSHQIVLLVAGIGVTIAVVFALLTSRMLHDQMTAETKARGAIIGRTLSDVAVRLVAGRDAIAAEATLRRTVRQNVGLDHAFIVDFRGEVLAHTFDGGFPIDLLRRGKTTDEKTGRHFDHDIRFDGQILQHVILPFGPESQGGVHLILDKTAQKAKIRAAQTKIGFAAFLLVLLGVGIAILIARRITKPLVRATRVISAYGQGEILPDAAIQEGTSPEIGELFAAFDAMRQQRETVEASLRDREHRLSTAERTTHIGNFDADLTTDAMVWSDEHFRISGFEPHSFEVKRGAFVQLVHPDDRDSVEAALKRTIDDGDPYEVEHRIIRPDGSQRFVHGRAEVILDAFGSAIRLMGTIQDITERKASEEVNQRFNRILESLLNEIYIFNAECCRFIQVNQGARENLGYDMEELRQITAWDIKPEIDEIAFRAMIAPLHSGEQTVLHFETVHQRKDGTQYPVEVHLQLFRDAAEPVFVAVIQDITERKASEEALRKANEGLEEQVAARTRELQLEVSERRQAQEFARESEERHRAVLESAADGIITIGEDGVIRSFNTAAEGIFGYSADQAIDRRINMLMPSDDAAKHDNYLGSYLRTGDAKIIGTGRELTGLRRSGETFPMDLSLSETVTRTGRVFTGIVRDITARKTTETELRNTLDELRRTQDNLVQSEKMASLGGLVAGVAHEINTPVGIGVTAASHLREKATELAGFYADGKVRRADLEAFLKTANESTEIVLSNLTRASDLIRSFKQVAVDQSSEERRIFGLGGYLEEVVLSLQPQLKKTRHKVTVDCDQGLQIDTFPGALSQIVTNLILNSVIHAYNDGQAGLLNVMIRESAGAIELVYTDDGKGIPSDQLPHIFDPFFTTRRGQGGSGLGLNIVHNLVTQKLGGAITCESEPGAGTCFRISFPATMRKAA